RGSFHDVNSVDVKLSGDARFRLALAKAEHAHAWHEHHSRIRVANRGGIRRCVFSVVTPVFFTIGLDCRLNRSLKFRNVTCRIPFHKKGTNLSTDEMVGTASSQVCQLGSPIRIHELQYLQQVRVVPDEALPAGNHSANDGK